MLVEDNFCGFVRANMIFLRLELKMNEIIKLKKSRQILSLLCVQYLPIYIYGRFYKTYIVQQGDLS